MSAMADDFDEAAIKAEEDAAKQQADALLAEVSKERRHTDRLRLKDHGDTRDRRRRSRSRERDRYVQCIDCTNMQLIKLLVIGEECLRSV